MLNEQYDELETIDKAHMMDGFIKNILQIVPDNDEFGDAFWLALAAATASGWLINYYHNELEKKQEMIEMAIREIAQQNK